jgi:hypothetical protein
MDISRRRVLAGSAAAPRLQAAQARQKPKPGTGSKGGMFDLAGIDISGIRRAVAPTGRVLTSARRAGMKIVYLKKVIPFQSR